MKKVAVAIVALAALVLSPLGAAAQTNSVFTGEVTDNTGGVLPGVTVEASSPILIEGSRIAITDGQGRYTIVDLRPGDYVLTFTLPGFTTVIRDQLVLPAGFTMTIDAEMGVGGLEETITVSGESPIVDVQSTRRAEVLDREMLDAIPTGPEPAVDRTADSGREDESPRGRADDGGPADLHVGPRHERPPGHGRGRRAAGHELRR